MCVPHAAPLASPPDSIWQCRPWYMPRDGIHTLEPSQGTHGSTPPPTMHYHISRRNRSLTSQFCEDSKHGARPEMVLIFGCLLKYGSIPRPTMHGHISTRNRSSTSQFCEGSKHGIGPHMVLILECLFKAHTTQFHDLQCIDIDEICMWAKAIA